MPAIAAAAHAKGAVVLMDNTWASPWLFRSFARAVDVSIHAATKYIVGKPHVTGVLLSSEARASMHLTPAALLPQGSPR